MTLLMFLVLKTFHAHFGIVVDADEMHTVTVNGMTCDDKINLPLVLAV